MIKWLRKHSKQIMVALVLIAMFSFVGGSALVNILSPKNTNPVLLKAFGHSVTNKELYNSQRDITLYETIGIPWKFGSPNMESYHWYMLVHEADDAGIVVTDAEVAKVVEALQQRALSPQMMQVLRRQHSMAMPEVSHAIRDFLAVNKNINRVSGAAVPSDPELRNFVRDTEDKVRVRFVALDAQSFVDNDRPVSNEEAQAQFEKYKTVDAGSGDAGWGYRHPNRVKVEYILADLPKIQPQIPLTQEEVIAYWRANKPKYRTTEYVDDPAATSAPAADPAATQPTTQPAKKKVEREKTFSEARTDVERELRTQKAAKLAGQAMGKAAGALLKPWFEVKADLKTGFKPIPPEVQAPDYMKGIAESISKETGIPLEFNATPLLSREKLATWPDLRGAKLAGGKGADRLTLSDYAFSIPAFLEKKPDRESTPTLQLFQTPDAPLTAESTGRFELIENRLVPSQGSTDRLVIFRVVHDQPAGEAVSLDEVREEVDRDVRLQRAFDAVKPVAEELCVVSRRLGIDQALPLFEELRTKHGVRDAVSPKAFPRRESMAKKQDRSGKYSETLMAGKPTLIPPEIPGLGSVEEFVDGCFQMADLGWKPAEFQLPPTTQMAVATTRPTASPEPLVRVLPLTKAHKWFVIQLLGTDLVDQNRFETQLKKTAYDAIEAERSKLLGSLWLKPENIELRCGYAPVRDGVVGRTDEGIMPTAPLPPVAPDIGY